MPYMSDPTIIARVQKYLERNTDKTYVDINEIADELQSQYREYAKRKRSAFRASVKKAYTIVLARYGLDSDNTPGNSDESSIDLNDYTPENDSMNNQLVDLYKKPAPIKNMDENELIDISSDDETEAPPSSVPTHISKDVRVHSINVDKNGIQPIHENEKNKKRKNSYATITNVIGQQQNKKRKYVSSANELRDGEINFSHVGGLEKTLEEVAKLLLHINHPEIYRTIGITPPRGFLLHGPPGCGKTLLAHAIAGELNIQLFKVTAPELVAGVSGESEQRIRNLFQRAFINSPCILFIDEIDAITQSRQNAQKDMEKRMVAQLLSCLDELNKSEQGSRVLVIGATNRPESIDPALRRSGRFDREICLGIPNKESRISILKIVTRKLKLESNFDFELLSSLTPGYVGADLLALTREAAMVAVDRMIREMKEIEKKIEEEEENEPVIVKAGKTVEKDPIVVTATSPPPISNVENEEKEDPDIIVDDTPEKPASAPTAPSDNLSEPIILIDDENQTKPTTTKKLGITQNISALDEILFWLHDQLPLSDEELESLRVTIQDFKAALKSVQPSAKREGFVTVPDTTWDDVGSLNTIREELQLSIVAPVRHSKQFESLGITVPAGVLLFGPPGCGKTLLAKAIANEAAINFISVKGPELLNMYVGESERAVRVCFERARNSAPCVIFFDELDALCPKRSHSDNSGTSRVVNQLLTEMDGISGRKGVFLLAATNRVDIIDPAVLRPGRLDKVLYVGLPNAADRADILKAITKNGTSPLLASDVSLLDIAERKECEGFTGADLAALVREASVAALKDLLCLTQQVDREGPLAVTLDHFNKAFRKIRGSVSEKDRNYYESMRRTFSSDRKDSEVEEMELS
ncbi:nuclear valosin-containing protein-like isoform X3 [Diorhabda sublineata]|uniref:nuclear valosin-containing protein-like isoform X3 n=1 Tax=Diorhabda sublineata TaxID=1163346 RepID=UPI0024E11258|nr:nuclear valosin-containing protein-like isoform X3 [Diorhabda sublineata]